MTQQDDITQRLRDNADLDEAEHGNARVVQLERDAADEIERLRAELSKLRAPVADEKPSPCVVLRREGGLYVSIDLEPDGEFIYGIARGTKVETGTWDFRKSIQPPAKLAAALASAPAAGEAKNYPGDNVAERLDKMADGQPPGSQAQSDLYAAATIWRKHIAHRAAPQASAVAGEAVCKTCGGSRVDPGGLPICRDCGPVAGEAQPVCWIEKDVLESVRDEGSDAWVYWRPAGHAAEPDEVPLYAAPQASAEDVRNAALEEAAAICDSVDNHANPMTARDCADAIRALKQPQADKDARPCTCHPDDRPAGDCQKQYAATECQQRAGDDLPAFMQSRMTPWGLLVRACRIVVDTTMMDMSRELGIRPSSLSSYEHGRKGLNDDFVIEVMRFFEDRGLCIPATAWRKAAIAATQPEQGERDEG